jgi:cell division protein FtsQ
MSGATTPAGRRRAATRGARAATAPRAKTGTPPRGSAARPSRAESPRPARSKPKLRARAKPKARPRSKVRAQPSRGRASRLRRRATVALVAAVALAIGYFAWFRDSSLVAVTHVTVSGLGGDSNPAAAALTRAAEGMTTLDVDQARLDAVAANPSFPHGMALRVVERPPVMIARDGGRRVPVAADGTVLVGVDAPPGTKLPTVAVNPLPATGRLTGQAGREARVLGAAAGPLRSEVAGISWRASRGITVVLHGGIQVRFGSASAAPAKWAAAAAVLADRRLDSLAYVDVRVPKRPAVG